MSKEKTETETTAASKALPSSSGSQIAGYRYDHKTNQYIPTINGIDTSPTTFDGDLALRLAQTQIDIANDKHANASR